MRGGREEKGWILISFYNLLYNHDDINHNIQINQSSQSFMVFQSDD